MARRPSVFAAGSGIAGVLLVLAVLLPGTAVADEPARKDVLLLYADIYAFVFDQKGLMAGVGIQGSKITRVNH